jgi:hypothetical protein
MNTRRGPKVDHDHERLLLGIDEILPSPENAELYNPVTPDDQKTIELSDSIKVHGILEPLVIRERHDATHNMAVRQTILETLKWHVDDYDL